MINGQGLYSNDTISMAAQAQGNDVVILFVGVPLLAFSGWLAFYCCDITLGDIYWHQ
jgi:hypothetical protein